MISLSQQTKLRTVAIFTYQPSLRPALPCVYGPLDYREQRALFERIDGKINTDAHFSVLALRANIARILTGLAHRDFCARLADSTLLQWFLHVGQVDFVKAFSKSSSDRFGQWVSEESLRTINQKYTALLAATAADNGASQTASATFGLPEPISVDDVCFDSACLKVNTVNIIVRGKAGANVEFGNKLWLGENRDGIIVDYKLYQDNPSDSTLAKPALVRLLDDQQLAVKQVWGDCGLASKVNSALLQRREIGDGFCPRDVTELSEMLVNEEGFREGLKRRAGTEARIGIFKNVFLGRPMLAKGFKHRELVVGWAALTHNLWVVARMAKAEEKRKEDQEQNTRLPQARSA